LANGQILPDTVVGFPRLAVRLRPGRTFHGASIHKGREVQPQSDTAGAGPRAIIVMGVSGSGKSTLGAGLAAILGCRFLEGDAFHDEAAVAKMRAGIPLDDADRWPWLDRLGAGIHDAALKDGLAVAACSALKRSYRERLTMATGVPTAFILPDVERDELVRRMNNRPGHYMPASLLDSQLATLERPEPGEPVLRLDGTRPLDQLCEKSLAWLRKAVAAR
jgi:gluconokinase